MAKELARLKLRIEADTAGLRRGLNVVEGQARRTGSTMSRAFNRAASWASVISLAARAAKTEAGGASRQWGGFSRCTRPPSWSIRIGVPARPEISFISATRPMTCRGSWQFRSNRMKPAGRVSAKKRLSSPVNAGPEHPKITALGWLGRASPWGVLKTGPRYFSGLIIKQPTWRSANRLHNCRALASPEIGPARSR